MGWDERLSSCGSGDGKDVRLGSGPLHSVSVYPVAKQYAIDKGIDASGQEGKAAFVRKIRSTSRKVIIINRLCK